MQRTRTFEHYGAIAGLRRPCPPAFSGFQVQVVYEPASETGGDFYFLTTPRFGELTVVIGDACGRGTQAAELVAGLDLSIRQLSRAPSRPGEFLSRLSRVAMHTLPDDAFVTAACLHLDVVGGSITAANAGHVPAIVRSEERGPRVLGRASGPPLGILPNASYEEDRLSLGEGDLVVLMTDGVFEAVERDLLNMSTLLELLKEPTSLSQANERILSRSTRSPWADPDDSTLLSVMVDPALHLLSSDVVDKAS